MKTCDNGDAGSDHGEGVTSCLTCEGTFCAPCREAVTGDANRCPQCNGYVGQDPSCRVGGGGCGK